MSSIRDVIVVCLSADTVLQVSRCVWTMDNIMLGTRGLPVHPSFILL